MKSYVEFVYLFHCVVCICSSLLAGFYLNLYIDKKKLIISVLIQNLILIFFYDQLVLFVVFITEITFTFNYCRKISLLFSLFMIRFSIILCMYLLFGGTVYYGIWFMRATSYQWILVSGILCIFTYVSLYRYSAFSKLYEYCYKVNVEFEGYRVCCYGYWDSGNFANHRGVPIIFLFDKRICLCNTKFVNVANGSVEVVLGSVTGIHIPKQSVYIAYINHEIENMYPCLLNQLLER